MAKVVSPVHQILGYSELLQEEAAEAGHESLVADLGKIQLAARHLLKIVDTALASPGLPLAPGAPVTPPVPVVPQPPPPLPVVFREDKDAASEAGEEVPGTAVGQVLVVDDNEMNRDMLSRRLAGRGYRVTGARDGRESLRLVDEGSFDAVLLDVMMPDLSGIEVLTRIRRTYLAAIEDMRDPGPELVKPGTMRISISDVFMVLAQPKTRVKIVSTCLV